MFDSFYHSYLFVNILILFMYNFSIYFTLVLCLCFSSALWMYLRYMFLSLCVVCLMPLFPRGCFLSFYFLPFNLPYFPLSLNVLWCFVENWAFEKTATSSCLCRLDHCCEMPSLIIKKYYETWDQPMVKA